MDTKINRIIEYLNKSKRPIFIVGNGVKQSRTASIVDQLSKKNKIPILTTRMANDLFPHNKNNIFGLAGIKGSRYLQKCKILI